MYIHREASLYMTHAPIAWLCLYIIYNALFVTFSVSNFGLIRCAENCARFSKQRKITVSILNGQGFNDHSTHSLATGCTCNTTPVGNASVTITCHVIDLFSADRFSGFFRGLCQLGHYDPPVCSPKQINSIDPAGLNRCLM